MITLTDEGEFLLQEGSWILNAVQDLESRVRNIPKLDNNIRGGGHLLPAGDPDAGYP